MDQTHSSAPAPSDACKARIMQLRDLAGNVPCRLSVFRRRRLQRQLACLWDQLRAGGELDAFERRPRQSARPWDWQELHRDRRLLVGLLRIYRHDPIPLHDHPGSTGIQLTLTGRLETEQFDLATGGPSPAPATLRRVSRRTMEPGTVSFFTPTCGNIHRLHSETGHSIQCCVLFDPYREGERRWFFPLSHSAPDQRHIEVSSLQLNQPQGGISP